jgi:PKD repeat protein
MSFIWNLGNGTTFNGNTPPNTVFTNSGTADSSYNVSLIASNQFGCTDTITKTITIRANPNAQLSSSTALECAPFIIDSTIINWVDYPLINGSYQWEFFNNQGTIIASGTDPNLILYTISQPADSIWLRFIAISPFGCANDTLIQLFETIPNPVPQFSVNNPAGCSPLSLQIIDSSSAGVSYEWYANDVLVSTSPNPNIVLSNFNTHSDSIFEVKLIVTAGTGCYDSLSRFVTVYALPYPNFSANPVCEGDTAIFNDLTTTVDSIVSWLWTFNQSVTDTNQNPTFIFNGYGYQNISLEVWDTRGCSQTFQDSLLIYPNPISNFTKAGNCEPQTICKGQTVTLNDSSFVPFLGGSINNWYWDIDEDGINDFTTQNINLTFSDTGTKVVRLITQTNFGCVDTNLINFFVSEVPNVSFGFDTTADCGPITVNLINNSTGRIEFSNWEVFTLDSLGNRQIMFSDTARAFPSSINLLPSYLADTTYYFELISGNCCGSDTVLKSITLKPLPVAAMLPSAIEGCTPLPITFQLDGLVTGSPDYLVLNYGDGRVDTLNQNYIVAGNGDTVWVWGQQVNTFINPLPYDTTYTVILTAYNDCGDSSVSVDILVHPNTVQAFFQANPSNGCEDLVVNFQDFSFGGSNISWCFDYDTLNQNCNQPVSVGTSFTHTYQNPGTYVVAQFVDDGCSYDTAYQTIVVYPAPITDFNFDNFQCEGDTINFFDLSDLRGASVQYNWQFGDSDSSYLTNPIHVYDSGGVYTVELILTSANGCKDSLSKTITIYDKPEVDFGFTNACFNEQPIIFSDSTNLVSGTVISTEWDFGDGNSSTFNNPLHTYSSPGNYTVTLIKISSYGCIDSVQKTINIYPEPTADFSHSRLGSDSCSVPQIIQFTNLSQNAQGYYWDFNYNGNPGVDTSSATDPNFTYTNFGVFEVGLFTTNSFGCKDSTFQIIFIRPVPEAGYFADTLGGCEPLSVQFIDTSNYGFNGPGGITSWFWDFGDGFTSNLQNPNHTYGDSGTFYTSLIIGTDGGCYDTIAGDFIRVSPRPVVSFEMLVNDGVEIQMVNTSLKVDSSTLYTWDFGDGNTSSLKNPKHRYGFDLREGEQNLVICLRAENSFGCADSLCVPLRLNSLQLNVPNAFAPEANVGSEANVFLPKGHSLEHYILRIYDKWGNIVFESKVLDEEGAPAEPWDGTHYINGTPLPMGSYTWRIDAQFLDGSLWLGKEYRTGERKNVGSVTLIR